MLYMLLVTYPLWAKVAHKTLVRFLITWFNFFYPDLYKDAKLLFLYVQIVLRVAQKVVFFPWNLVKQA